MGNPTFKSLCDFMQAKAYARITENAGYNDDKAGWIDSLCDWAGVPRGSSYCAMALSRGMEAAGCDLRKQFIKTASSQAIKRWAAKNGRLFTDPQHLLECKGAIGGWTNKGDAAHGHVFCVKGRLTDAKGRVVAVQTLEANTGPGDAGSQSNGDGVYERERDVSPMSSNWWFVDLTGIEGGEWWN